MNNFAYKSIFDILFAILWFWFPIRGPKKAYKKHTESIQKEHRKHIKSIQKAYILKAHRKHSESIHTDYRNIESVRVNTLWGWDNEGDYLCAVTTTPPSRVVRVTDITPPPLIQTGHISLKGMVIIQFPLTLTFVSQLQGFLLKSNFRVVTIKILLKYFYWRCFDFYRNGITCNWILCSLKGNRAVGKAGGC